MIRQTQTLCEPGSLLRQQQRSRRVARVQFVGAQAAQAPGQRYAVTSPTAYLDHTLKGASRLG